MTRKITVALYAAELVTEIDYYVPVEVRRAKGITAFESLNTVMDVGDMFLRVEEELAIDPDVELPHVKFLSDALDLAFETLNAAL